MRRQLAHSWLGGYIPFSLKQFAPYHLITGLFKHGKAQDFIQILLDAG
jgi:hypothetical protein